MAIDVSQAMVDQIVQYIGAEHIIDETNPSVIVGNVLAAWNALIDGDPINTVLQNPETGAIAHRVNEDGVHKWKCSDPSGAQWSDLQPTLPGWVKLSG